MYIDKDCEQSNIVGKRYKVKEVMPVRCCNTIIPINDVIEICVNTSKKIVLIKTIDGKAKKGAYHKVKMSTLDRVTEEIYND